MARPVELVLRFELEKETKNTLRYQEIPEAGAPPKIGTLYVQKWAVEDAPTFLVVTVKEKTL